MMADTLAITMVDVQEPAKQQQQDEPYSVFSTRTKILIVMTVSISGFFSPFSTNIYFPALSMIEKASIIAISIYLSIVPMGLVTYSHTSAVLGSCHYRENGQFDCNHVHGVSGHCTLFLGKFSGLAWT